jgi:hypothetical protein
VRALQTGTAPERNARPWALRVALLLTLLLTLIVTAIRIGDRATAETELYRLPGNKALPYGTLMVATIALRCHDGVPFCPGIEIGLAMSKGGIP